MQRMPRLYVVHETLQELVAGAWEDADDLERNELRVWLPVLVRVSRCANAVERMVVRARVVPEQVLEVYMDAVKLQAKWLITLRQADSALADSNEDYYKEALERLVASLRALLPGPAPPTAR